MLRIIGCRSVDYLTCVPPRPNGRILSSTPTFLLPTMATSMYGLTDARYAHIVEELLRRRILQCILGLITGAESTSAGIAVGIMHDLDSHCRHSLHTMTSFEWGKAGLR